MKLLFKRTNVSIHGRINKLLPIATCVIPYPTSYSMTFKKEASNTISRWLEIKVQGFLSFGKRLRPEIVSEKVVLFATIITASYANFALKSSFVLKERMVSENSFQFTSGFIYRKARSKSSLAISDSIASFTSSLFSGRISSKSLIGTSIFL